MNPVCAVCGVSSYWVGWDPAVEQYRCLNHLGPDHQPAKPKPGGLMNDDTKIDMIDGRDALGIFVLRNTPDGVGVEVKGLRIRPEQAAELLEAAAQQLRAADYTLVKGKTR